MELTNLVRGWTVTMLSGVAFWFGLYKLLQYIVEG